MKQIEQSKNKIVADNGDGTFGVQEYCAGCGRDMGVRMHESREKADWSVQGISEIRCEECGKQSPPFHPVGVPTKKALRALQRDGVVM